MCVIQVIIEVKIPLVIKQNVFSSKNNALLRFLNALDARVHEREKLFNILRYFLKKKKKKVSILLTNAKTVVVVVSLKTNFF